MEKYSFVSQCGSGSFAIVYEARVKNNQKPVAIKYFRTAPSSWEECVQLDEVRVAKHLGTHANIIGLKEVVYEHGYFFLVFEYCHGNVFDTINALHHKKSGVDERTIRWVMKQILNGLAHMHRRGLIHRDIKPENILIQNNFKPTLKICDFGQTKLVSDGGKFTPYVGTRWYRAPEQLLKARKYTSAVDMWAVGALMAELYIRRPIFGGSSEMDQLFKICSTLGSPSEQEWSRGHRLATANGYSFPRTTGIGIGSVVSSASANAVDLIEKMLRLNPDKRISAKEALSHSFFTEGAEKPLKAVVTKATAAARAAANKAQEELMSKCQQASQGGRSLSSSSTVSSTQTSPSTTSSFQMPSIQSTSQKSKAAVVPSSLEGLPEIGAKSKSSVYANHVGNSSGYSEFRNPNNTSNSSKSSRSSIKLPGALGNISRNKEQVSKRSNRKKSSADKGRYASNELLFEDSVHSTSSDFGSDSDSDSYGDGETDSQEHQSQMWNAQEMPRIIQSNSRKKAAHLKNDFDQNSQHLNNSDHEVELSLYSSNDESDDKQGSEYEKRDNGQKKTLYSSSSRFSGRSISGNKKPFARQSSIALIDDSHNYDKGTGKYQQSRGQQKTGRGASSAVGSLRGTTTSSRYTTDEFSLKNKSSNGRRNVGNMLEDLWSSDED